MISIFRKMRIKNIGKNSTRNYLKYALGEVILVTLGILIALQINNWNEERKLKIKEIVYLNEILSDLKYNKLNVISSLESDNNYNRDSIVGSFNFIINHLEQGLAYEDTLSQLFFCNSSVTIYRSKI